MYEPKVMVVTLSKKSWTH